jgi:hypothetical protein
MGAFGGAIIARVWLASLFKNRCLAFPTYNAPSFPSLPMKRPKLAIACVAFVACSLLSTARLVVDAPTPARIKEHSGDVANRSDRRFAALRASLPQRGVVGYVGEPGALALGDYYLAEYALAPLVLDHSPNHALVVGNFPASPPSAPPENLHLVKDFGNGVLLYASKDTK